MIGRADSPENLQRICDQYNARPDHNPALMWIVAGTHIKLIEAKDYRPAIRREVV